LVIDGTLGSIGKATEPCEMRLEAGQLVSASGEQGAAFIELLRGAGEDGTRIAELGIGTNEKAIVTGNLLEDEKILGSCHVAFGASAGIGGDIQVPIHEDCVVLEPTVTVDGEPLITAGELVV
jgi:leucyl aminopeptidase (aminopeptidase T)